MSTGQVIGGVVGAAAGFVLTGGTPMGALYGAQAGMMVGGYLDPVKGPEQQGPRLSDTSVQTSTYGAFIPRLYGTVAVSGNVFWIENNKRKETPHNKQTGGKGGGSSGAETTYTYSATLAIGICEGPIEGIRRIWAGPNLIYDAGTSDLESVIASNRALKKFSIYLGDDTQLPDSRMQADLGAANTPAYRGLCYVVIKDFQLAKYGNAIPVFKIEVCKAASYATPTLIQSYTRPSQIIYTDDSIIQTGVMTDIGSYSGSTLTASATFTDYNALTGALIRSYTVTTSIQANGYTPSSSSDVGGCIVHGKNGVVAVSSKRAGKVAIGFSDADFGQYGLAVTTALPRSGGFNELVQWAGGAYWVMNSSGGIERIDSGVLTSLSNPVAFDARQYIAQDAQTGRLFIRYTSTAGGTWVKEITTTRDPSVADATWQVSTSQPGLGQMAFSVDGGRLADGTHGIRLFDVDSHTEIQTSVVNPGTFYDRITYYSETAFVASGGIYTMANHQTELTTTVSSVLSAECLRSGLLSAGDIDVTAISNTMVGFRVGTLGSIRSAIEPLQAAFPFDAIQSGYKLKFVPRGQSSVASVVIGDLSVDEQLRQTREMDSQMPTQLTATYLDRSRNYDVNQQVWERPSTGAVNSREVQLPMTLESSQAAQIVERLGYLYWLERTDFGPFTLPPTFSQLEPSDVIGLDAGYASYELRLTSVNYKSDGSIECSAKLNNSAVYVSTAVADAVPDNTGIALSGASLFVPLDIPVVDESIQNTAGFVGVMTGYSGSWPGGVAFRSADGGQTWDDIQGYSGLATIGYAAGTLPASDCTLIDQRVLTVTMLSGALESVTQDQMLSGVNWAAYGADGRWELVRFQTAALQVDGSYLVSGFVRGQRGSEWATGLHQVGDYFILLDDPDNTFIGLPSESIGVTRTYRGITSGDDIDSGSDQPFTYRGVNLECLSPVYASGTRDGSGNFSGAFTRRSRVSGTWWTTGTVTPVGEASESYEIDVMSGSTVKRTISVTSPAFSYSAASQTTDFGSAQASITYRIYQLSAVVGRGYPLEVAL